MSVGTVTGKILQFSSARCHQAFHIASSPRRVCHVISMNVSSPSISRAICLSKGRNKGKALSGANHSFATSRPAGYFARSASVKPDHDLDRGAHCHHQEAWCDATSRSFSRYIGNVLPAPDKPVNQSTQARWFLPQRDVRRMSSDCQ